MVTLQRFLADRQGRWFGDVTRDDRLPFVMVLDFFNDPGVLRAMLTPDGRCPLARVIGRFEALPVVAGYFANNDAHTTMRARQAVGVVVRMVMEANGFRRTGMKESLGRRCAIAPRTTVPGAYRNVSGVSRWFTKSECYA